MCMDQILKMVYLALDVSKPIFLFLRFGSLRCPIIVAFRLTLRWGQYPA